jgi:hypothetical protein
VELDADSLEFMGFVSTLSGGDILSIGGFETL